MSKVITKIFTLLLVVAVVAGLVIVLDHISDPEGNSSEYSSDSVVSDTDNPGDSSDTSAVAPDISDNTSDPDATSADESTDDSKPDNSSDPDSSDDPTNDDSDIGDFPGQGGTPNLNLPPRDSADTVLDFIACPDNLIHPSIYVDSIIRAAEKNGTTPSYSNLAAAEYDFASIYSNIAPRIRQADLAYVNVESLIGGNHNPIRGYPRFNTPEAMGETLFDVGFNIFNLAHNHMLDSGDDRYLTFAHSFFTERGGTAIGYYKDKSASDKVVIVEQKGIKVALLTYTTHTNGISLKSTAQTYIPYFEDNLIKKQVAYARQNADIIIVSAHWGRDDTTTVDSTQKRYAQLLIDLGVDVIVGMGPHCLQPMKWVTNANNHRTLLAYSLGNFLSGSQDGFNLLGGMLSFDIVKSAKTGMVYIDAPLITPVVTHYIKPGGGAIQTDTGHRQYKLYYLKDYTSELANVHAVHSWERSNKATLVGGKFSLDTLKGNVRHFIPAEFLPAWLKD